MSDKKVVTFEFRKGTTSEWTSKNPVLAAGEPGFDTETKTLKMGDGLTPWVNLPSVGGNELQIHYRNQTVEGLPEFNGPALVHTLYPKPAMVAYGLWSPGYYGTPDDLLNFENLSVGSDPDNALSVDTTYEYYTLEEYLTGPQSIMVSPTTSSAYVTLVAPEPPFEYLNDPSRLGNILSVAIKTPSVWSNGTIKILSLNGYVGGPNFLSVDLDVVSGKASFVLRDNHNVEVARSTNAFGVDEKVRVEVLAYGDHTVNEEGRGYKNVFLNIYRYGESTTTWSSQPIKIDFDWEVATTVDVGKINEGPSNISDLLISDIFFEAVPSIKAGPTLGREYEEETGDYVDSGNGQALGRIGYVSENSDEFTFESEEDMWNYFSGEEEGSSGNSSLTDYYRVSPTMATDTFDRLTLEVTQRSVNNVIQHSWNGLAYEVQTKLEMSFESPTDPGSNIRELHVDLNEIESEDLHWWNRGPEGGTGHLPPMYQGSPFEGMHGSEGWRGADPNYFAGHMPVTVVARVEKYDSVNGYDDDVYFDVDRSFTAIVSWSIGEVGIPDGWIDNALIIQIAHPMDAMVDINNRFGDQTKDRVTYHATIEYSDVEAPAMLG